MRRQRTISLIEIRRAVADYMWTEGCGCCCDIRDHRKHEEQLAKLLHVPEYDDGSGYDFPRFRTRQ